MEVKKEHILDANIEVITPTGKAECSVTDSGYSPTLRQVYMPGNHWKRRKWFFDVLSELSEGATVWANHKIIYSH